MPLASLTSNIETDLELRLAMTKVRLSVVNAIELERLAL